MKTTDELIKRLQQLTEISDVYVGTTDGEYLVHIVRVELDGDGDAVIYIDSIE